MHSEATHALWDLVGRVGKLCRKQAIGDCEDAGTLAVFGQLFQDGWNARMRMTEISRKLQISKPAATQVVARMVDHGLVERVSDASDRRVVYIQATAPGRELYERELEQRLALADRVIARLGEESANELVRQLNRFLDALAAETEEN